MAEPYNPATQSNYNAEADDALMALDPIFSRPVGPDPNAKPPAGSKPSTAFPELGLTRNQERGAAAVVGAAAGPALQTAAQKLFPSKEMRTAEGVKKLREQEQLAQMMQRMRDEELLRMGIQPEAAPKTATSGTKWLQNWAGMDREIAGGVPEGAAAYNRSKGQGKISGRLTKMYGPLEPGQSIADKLLANANTAEQGRNARAAAMPAAQAAAAQRLAQATPGPMAKVANVMKSPITGGALSGAGAGLSFYEAYRRYMDGDRSGAVIAALGGTAAIASMIPGLQLPGTAVSAGSAVGLGINDLLKSQDAAPELTPTEARSVNRPAMPGSMSMDPRVQAQRGYMPMAPLPGGPNPLTQQP